MREYKFAELSVGMKESFEKEITPEMEHAFRDISGDDNPLHRDDLHVKQETESFRSTRYSVC